MDRLYLLGNAVGSLCFRSPSFSHRRSFQAHRISLVVVLALQRMALTSQKPRIAMEHGISIAARTTAAVGHVGGDAAATELSPACCSSSTVPLSAKKVGRAERVVPHHHTLHPIGTASVALGTAWPERTSVKGDSKHTDALGFGSDMSGPHENILYEWVYWRQNGQSSSPKIFRESYCCSTTTLLQKGTSVAVDAVSPIGACNNSPVLEI